MFKVGDKDKSNSVCKYVKGPVAIWEAPDGQYGIYLAVKDKTNKPWYRTKGMAFISIGFAMMFIFLILQAIGV